MHPHRGGSAAHIPVLDSLDDYIVLVKTVMVAAWLQRRWRAGGPHVTARRTALMVSNKPTSRLFCVASAMVRCNRLSQVSYCRQVPASRMRATQASHFLQVDWGRGQCAARAISGSMISLTRITSAGLVRLARAAMSANVSRGRLPMKVPLPT